MNLTIANWTELRALASDVLEAKEQGAYLKLLDDLRPDHKEETNGFRHFLGFERAPAATRNHHAYEGGLVAHLLEMHSLWQGLRERFLCPPFVTDQRVLKAIILHDLHKSFKTYQLLRHDVWEVKFGDDDTDLLMISEIKSLWLATRAGIELDPLQINALLLSEGGYSKIQPKWSSVLAKTVYCLDELSGNGLARIKTGTLLHQSRIEKCV